MGNVVIKNNDLAPFWYWMRQIAWELTLHAAPDNASKYAFCNGSAPIIGNRFILQWWRKWSLFEGDLTRALVWSGSSAFLNTILDRTLTVRATKLRDYTQQIPGSKWSSTRSLEASKPPRSRFPK